MAKNLQFGINSRSNITTKRELQSVRVMDIILSPSHPKFSTSDSIGTIFYADIVSNKSTENPETLHTAVPLFSFQKYFPLINEIVLILDSDINTSTKSKQKIKYYLPNINIGNNPHHNAIPIVENYNNNSSNYNNTLDGSVKKSQNNALDIPLGETFVEKDFIKPLRPFEGDNILEGRFGNTIRLGSTSRPLNPWSQNGENSDPIIIIRNGQFNDINDETFNPNIEDINNDDSSIYLTSNQNISNFEVASKNLQSYSKGELPYISPEDRLVLGPKTIETNYL